MRAGTRQRISGVTAAVVVAHATLAWLVLHRLNTPALPGQAEQVILASVVAEVPAAATTPRAIQAQPVAPAPAQRPPPQVSRPTTVLQTAPAATQSTAQAPAPSAAAAATAPATATPSTARAPAPAAATVILPSSDADYLNNPAPTYPRMSRRMGEQGTVLVRVLISAEGRAEQAEIRTSSGYVRLDEAALDTVKRWRYVPGKRTGVAEAMWFNVPVRFVLD